MLRKPSIYCNYFGYCVLWIGHKGQHVIADNESALAIYWACREVRCDPQYTASTLGRWLDTLWEKLTAQERFALGDMGVP